MNYTEFKDKFGHLPLIQSADFGNRGQYLQTMRNQLTRWTEKGLLIKLKRGLYVLNTNDRRVNPDKQFIANQLYSPSYVSLEYALSFYGLIPEGVYDITSVTTKKTLRNKNAFGTFIYQHIKPNAFRGFVSIKDESGLDFFIAEPEKAVVDFVYLNLSRFKGEYKNMLSESFRFQNIEGLKQARLLQFAMLFENVKLHNVIRAFCALSKSEAKR